MTEPREPQEPTPERNPISDSGWEALYGRLPELPINELRDELIVVPEFKGREGGDINPFYRHPDYPGLIFRIEPHSSVEIAKINAQGTEIVLRELERHGINVIPHSMEVIPTADGQAEVIIAAPIIENAVPLEKALEQGGISNDVVHQNADRAFQALGEVVKAALEKGGLIDTDKFTSDQFMIKDDKLIFTDVGVNQGYTEVVAADPSIASRYEPIAEAIRLMSKMMTDYKHATERELEAQELLREIVASLPEECPSAVREMASHALNAVREVDLRKINGLDPWDETGHVSSEAWAAHVAGLPLRPEIDKMFPSLEAAIYFMKTGQEIADRELTPEEREIAIRAAETRGLEVPELGLNIEDMQSAVDKEIYERRGLLPLHIKDVVRTQEILPELGLDQALSRESALFMEREKALRAIENTRNELREIANYVPVVEHTIEDPVDVPGTIHAVTVEVVYMNIDIANARSLADILEPGGNATPEEIKAADDALKAAVLYIRDAYTCGGSFDPARFSQDRMYYVPGTGMVIAHVKPMTSGFVLPVPELREPGGIIPVVDGLASLGRSIAELQGLAPDQQLRSVEELKKAFDQLARGTDGEPSVPAQFIRDKAMLALERGADPHFFAALRGIELGLEPPDFEYLRESGDTSNRHPLSVWRDFQQVQGTAPSYALVEEFRTDDEQVTYVITGQLHPTVGIQHELEDRLDINRHILRDDRVYVREERAKGYEVSRFIDPDGQTIRPDEADGLATRENPNPTPPSLEKNIHGSSSSTEVVTGSGAQSSGEHNESSGNAGTPGSETGGDAQGSTSAETSSSDTSPSASQFSGERHEPTGPTSMSGSEASTHATGDTLPSSSAETSSESSPNTPASPVGETPTGAASGEASPSEASATSPSETPPDPTASNSASTPDTPPQGTPSPSSETPSAAETPSAPENPNDTASGGPDAPHPEVYGESGPAIILDKDLSKELDDPTATTADKDTSSGDNSDKGPDDSGPDDNGGGTPAPVPDPIQPLPLGPAPGAHPPELAKEAEHIRDRAEPDPAASTPTQQRESDGTQDNGRETDSQEPTSSETPTDEAAAATAAEQLAEQQAAQRELEVAAAREEAVRLAVQKDVPELGLGLEPGKADAGASEAATKPKDKGKEALGLEQLLPGDQPPTQEVNRGADYETHEQWLLRQVREARDLASPSERQPSQQTPAVERNTPELSFGEQLARQAGLDFSTAPAVPDPVPDTKPKRGIGNLFGLRGREAAVEPPAPGEARPLSPRTRHSEQTKARQEVVRDLVAAAPELPHTILSNIADGLVTRNGAARAAYENAVAQRVQALREQTQQANGRDLNRAQAAGIEAQARAEVARQIAEGATKNRAAAQQREALARDERDERLAPTPIKPMTIEEVQRLVQVAHWTPQDRAAYIARGADTRMQQARHLGRDLTREQAERLAARELDDMQGASSKRGNQAPGLGKGKGRQYGG